MVLENTLNENISGKSHREVPLEKSWVKKKQTEHVGANKMEHICMSDKSWYESLVAARSSHGRND